MKKQAFSLVEVLLAATIFAMLMTALLSMFAATIKSFTFTNNQYDADMEASLALQNLSRSLQEAKQVTINSPTSITISYPQKDVNGVYIRNTLDTVNYINIFRGNTNFTANPTGNCLILKPSVGTPRVICSNLTSLEFRSFTATSVDVTLRADYGLSSQVRNCQMIHRAIFLRNS